MAAVHEPRAFGVDDRAAIHLVLGDHMIDRSADALNAGGENAFRQAEEELHEVGIVDVQVEQRAAGLRAIEIGAAAPAGAFGNAPEARGQHLAVALIGDRFLEPCPFRPETHAHRRQQEALGLAGGGDDFARIRRAAGQRLFTNDVLAGFQGGHRHRHMQRGGHTEIDEIDVGIGQ